MKRASNLFCPYTFQITVNCNFLVSLGNKKDPKSPQSTKCFIIYSNKQISARPVQK
jgi:hypothetical protein